MQLQNTDEALANILTTALEAAKKTGEFVIEQAPDLIQQLLLFNFVKSTVMAVICFVTTYLFFWSVKNRHWLTHEEFTYGPKYQIGPQIVVWIFVLPLSIGFGIWNFMNALKIAIAPKIWLIEYTVGLVQYVR